MEKTNLNVYDSSLIGGRIKMSREAKEYTQEELAKLIGAELKHVVQIENGTVEMSIFRLIDICRTLDVSPDYILFGIVHKEYDTSINEIISKLPPDKKQFTENLVKVVVDFYEDNL